MNKRRFIATCVVGAIALSGAAFATGSAGADGNCHSTALFDDAFVACQQGEFVADQHAESIRAASVVPSYPVNIGGGWLISDRGNQEPMYRFDIWQFSGPNALNDAIAYRAGKGTWNGKPPYPVIGCNGLQTVCQVGNTFIVQTMQQIPGVASKTG